MKLHSQPDVDWAINAGGIGIDAAHGMTIDDDGSGFLPPACEETLRGIGLMYRRARVSGGKLTVNSRTGGGTKVLCTWAKTD